MSAERSSDDPVQRESFPPEPEPANEMSSPDAEKPPILGGGADADSSSPARALSHTDDDRGPATHGLTESLEPELTVLPVADALAELPLLDGEQERLSAKLWVANVLAVILPFLGLGAAAVFFWGWGFHWVDLGLLLGMYVLTAIGITVGFHRLFTHRSFETYAPVQFVLGVLGSMTVQGPLLKWVALHRRHHEHSDEVLDPHSPHRYGSGVIGLLRGLWHAHLGWVFRPDPPDLDRYVKDLRHSGMLRMVSALFPLWVALGLVLPAALGGVISLSWMGVWTGLMWGGLGRIFLVHHVTWSVNSVCHLWGMRPYRTGDQSRNNFLFGILAMGEGWHNSHHAFPTSARHGLRWWQPDVSYLVIRSLALLHLAWNVKVPNREAQARQRKLPGAASGTSPESSL
jgi:stearoyl-CoA desaturase (delta-9 desaturase)